MERFHRDLMGRVAEPDAQHAGLRLARKGELGGAGVDGRGKFRLLGEARAGLRGFPEGAISHLGDQLEGLAMRHDQLRGQIAEGHEGVAGNPSQRHGPALQRVPTRRRRKAEGERDRDQHRSEHERGAAGGLLVHHRAKVVLGGFLRDLADGRAAQRRGHVLGVVLFLRQFHNAQQAVAQPAVGTLNDLRQGPPVPAFPDPVLAPVHGKPSGSAGPGEEQRGTDQLGRVADAVTEEGEGEGTGEGGHAAAHGPGGFGPPQCAVERSELRTERLWERDAWVRCHWATREL